MPAAPPSLDAIAGLPPATALAQLGALARSLPERRDPGALEAIARSLPARVAALSPEVCLALADVALALRDAHPRLPDDLVDLPTRLAVAWLRVELSTGRTARLAALDETLLLHVVTGWSLDTVPAASPLLMRMAKARDARLRAAVLPWLAPAVQGLAIAPDDAVACLDRLATDAEPTIRSAAVRLLSACWLLGLSPRAQMLREKRIDAAIADADAGVARAAIDAAAALGDRARLAPIALDASRDGPLRAAALAALGPLAENDDIDLALAAAAEDPLKLGPSARRFLLDAHRHGVFVREPHIAPLLALFDAHAAWTSEELVRVTHIVRAKLIEHLAELPADDARWRRRAAILAASAEPAATQLLAALLGAVTDPAVAAACVDAAARSPAYDGEELLLRWLDDLPDAVIPALRVKGGEDAGARLRTVALDPFTTPGIRAKALGALWAITKDRGPLLLEASAALGPHESGLLDSRSVSRRDASVAKLLVAHAWPAEAHHDVTPLAALRVLCESGDASFLPDVTRLFREVFAGYVGLALAGDFSIKRLSMPELEQLVFRYGRHLVQDGRVVRRWIADAPETGRDLVLRVACEWLEESPPEPVCVALLETIGRHAPDGAVLRFIEPFWRRGGANVRRAAIEAILTAGEAARGLELSLGRLARTKDPRIVTQALAAVRTMRASWAEAMVRATLERPEMGVKKEAAEALAEIGTERSIPALVGWLARHDNASFRASLLTALDRAAGPATAAVLVSAIDTEEDARAKELLLDALSGRLALPAAVRLARSKRASRGEIVDACLDGRVRLAGATRDDLAAELHRARLRPAETKEDPARRLRVFGFSPEAAAAVVAARAPADDAALLPVVRAEIAAWVTWLGDAPDPDPAAVALVLDAADAAHGEQIGRLLDVLERTRRRVEPETVASFCERCVAHPSAGALEKARAAAVVRALPPSERLGGVRRYRLLGKLGAARTRADLEACLDACRVRPDGAAESAALLVEVFAIPPRRDDEPAEATAMRRAAEDWFRTDAAARGAWLGRMLAARPLDLPLLPPDPAPPAKPPFAPASRADLESLLAALAQGDEQARARAAARLLDWADARDAWPVVLDAFLAGRVEIAAAYESRVASVVAAWPDGSAARQRAVRLVPHLAPWQLRALLPAWADAWERGDASIEGALRAVGHERLLACACARAKAGSYGLVRLLEPKRSRALRALVAWVGERAPHEVEHLIPRETEPRTAAAKGASLDDPLTGKGLDDLVSLIATKDVERGLAVRAVHALVAHGDRAAAPLERLAVDRRPEVRSAALRALRMVAPRDTSLRAAAAALAIESRRDVILQLMATLGHGRYEPALPLLLERLASRDPRFAEGARAALRAWGRGAIPAVRHAARRARPDLRRHYAALLADLE